MLIAFLTTSATESLAMLYVPNPSCGMETPLLSSIEGLKSPEMSLFPCILFVWVVVLLFLVFI